MKNKKIVLLFLSILFCMLGLSTLQSVNAADGDQLIKLKVVFLEEGTNQELAPAKELEGDQGVFASISIPDEVNQNYTISSQGFDAEALNKIQNNDLYSSQLVYQIFFKKKVELDTPPVVQAGTHTLKVEEYNQNGNNWQINYPEAVDSTGKPIKQSQKQTTNFAHTFGYFTIDDSNVLVWCFDPNLPANHGDKYELRSVAENLQAALIQNFGVGYPGQELNALNASTEQKRLWELLGNTFPNAPYVIERGNGQEQLRQLTETEKAQIEAFNQRIDQLIALYQSNKTANFTLAEPSHAVYNATTHLISADINDKAKAIIVNADKEMLEAYKNGNITTSKGIQVEVDEGNGQLKITADSSVQAGEYTLEFSMIREAYTGESQEYYSNYGGQPLQVNRVQNPKKETLKVKFEEAKAPGKVEISLTKRLTGRELKAGEFTFVLTDQDGNTVQEVTNTQDGQVVFSLKLTEAGEYSYTVSEISGADETVEYDSSQKNVTLQLTAARDEDGQLVLIPTIHYPSGRVFDNKIKPELEPPTTEEQTTTTEESTTTTEESTTTTAKQQSELPKTGTAAISLPVIGAASLVVGVMLLKRKFQ